MKSRYLIRFCIILLLTGCTTLKSSDSTTDSTGYSTSPSLEATSIKESEAKNILSSPALQPHLRLRMKLLTLISILAGAIIFIAGCDSNSPPLLTPIVSLPAPFSFNKNTPLPTVAPTSSLTPFPTWSPEPPTAISTIALDPQHWEHISIPFEKSSVEVQHIIQSGDGSMWFVRVANVYQYQEKSKKWSEFDTREIPDFHGKKIESIVAAPDGKIWFGTDQNEIVSFNGKTWSSQAVEEGGYRDNLIASILFRKNGELCATSIEGISCKKNESQWIRHSIALPDKTNTVYVQKVVLSPKDNIWISLSNGWLYDYDGKKWEGNQIDKWLGPIASSADGSLWLYYHDRLAKRNLTGSIKYTDIYPFFRWAPPIVIYEATDETIWIGCMGENGYEVIRYNKDGTFETADRKILSTKDLGLDLNYRYPFGNVYAVNQAKDGSIWFGTTNGIFHFNEVSIAIPSPK